MLAHPCPWYQLSLGACSLYGAPLPDVPAISDASSGNQQKVVAGLEATRVNNRRMSMVSRSEALPRREASVESARSRKHITARSRIRAHGA